MEQQDVGTIMSWFSSPVYSRYWQHYEQAMGWYQNHRRAYSKALEAAYGPGFHQQHCPSSQARYRDSPSSQARYRDGPSSQARYRDSPSSQARYRDSPSSQARYRDSPSGQARYRDSPSSQARYADWEESSSDSDIECDVSNMEISEELRQYFAQTEKHREELKIQQQMEAEQQDYVPADQDLRRASYRTTVAPPSERPGERRAAEMKKLYGKDASKIMGMEAAMQLNFDRNCDLKQPKYWPVIPLKL